MGDKGGGVKEGGGAEGGRGDTEERGRGLKEGVGGAGEVVGMMGVPGFLPLAQWVSRFF